MQEKHLDLLSMSVFDNEGMKSAVKKSQEAFANAPEGEKFQNANNVLSEMMENETTNLPEGHRTPTAEEVHKMREFAREYRKKKPKAKPREVARAVKSKFNIITLPNM